MVIKDGITFNNLTFHFPGLAALFVLSTDNGLMA